MGLHMPDPAVEDRRSRLSKQLDDYIAAGPRPSVREAIVTHMMEVHARDVDSDVAVLCRTLRDCGLVPVP